MQPWAGTAGQDPARWHLPGERQLQPLTAGMNDRPQALAAPRLGLAADGVNGGLVPVVDVGTLRVLGGIVTSCTHSARAPAGRLLTPAAGDIPRGPS